jgi:hypothetical protein
VITLGGEIWKINGVQGPPHPRLAPSNRHQRGPRPPGWAPRAIRARHPEQADAPAGEALRRLHPAGQDPGRRPRINWVALDYDGLRGREPGTPDAVPSQAG